VALGLSPDLGASWLLTRRIGMARAQQIFMLNRPLDAERCLQWGLVDEVHPRDQLQAQADKLVAQLVAGPAASYARVKDLCARATRNTLVEHLQLERKYLVACAGTTDANEGVRAFIEKRPAKFGG
jgi:2-(1,2-epoxy-1,2-dihydrophenyl)acetyl-CoA isomerase